MLALGVFPEKYLDMQGYDVNDTAVAILKMW